MQRVFVAIDISDEARVAAARYTEKLRRGFPRVRVGWERPEKLHFTLKFLGNIDDARVSALKDAMAAASASTTRLRLRLVGTGVFPGERKPRVLWLGLEDATGGLNTLARSVEDHCVRVGFPHEGRAFKPHLTVGRVKEPHNAGSLAETHLVNAFGPIEFLVDELVIFKSELRPTGSVYSKLAGYPLKN